MIHYTEDEYPAIWNLMTEKAGKPKKLAWILWYCNPDKNEDINDFDRYIETMGLNMALQELLKPWNRIPFQAKYKAKCGCSQALEYVFYVEHKNGEVQLDIGSTCIENFGDEFLVAELHKYKCSGPNCKKYRGANILCDTCIVNMIKCIKCERVYDKNDKYCKKCYYACDSCKKVPIRKYPECRKILQRGDNKGKECAKKVNIESGKFCVGHMTNNDKPMHCKKCKVAINRAFKLANNKKYIIYVKVNYNDKDDAKKMGIIYTREAGESRYYTVSDNPLLYKILPKYRQIEERRDSTLVEICKYKDIDYEDAIARGYVYYRKHWCRMVSIFN